MKEGEEKGSLTKDRSERGRDKEATTAHDVEIVAGRCPVLSQTLSFGKWEERTTWFTE